MPPKKKTRRAASIEAFSPPANLSKSDLEISKAEKRKIQNRRNQQKHRAKIKKLQNAAIEAHEGAELTEGTSHTERPEDAANDGEGSVQSVPQCSSRESTSLSSPSLMPASPILNDQEPKRTDAVPLLAQYCRIVEEKLPRTSPLAHVLQPQPDFADLLDPVIYSDDWTPGQPLPQYDLPRDTHTKYVQQYESQGGNLYVASKQLRTILQQQRS